MPSQFEIHLHRVQSGLAKVEYVYLSHDRWPLSRQAPTGPRLNISVLDSSFNPPTLAHKALAETSFPESFKNTLGERERFHARLLLLSVRNADKLLNSSDATYAQRLEMMVLLAKDLSTVETLAPSAETQSTHEVADSNVAVAIIDEPTFVGKSNVLRTSIRERISQLSQTDVPAAESSGSRPSSSANPCLNFLVGMDTLDRLFAPRYYSSEEKMQASLRQFLSPDGDDSRVICARRSGLAEDPEVLEARTLTAAREFIHSDRIALVDLDSTLATLSSSAVRRQISGGTPDFVWKSFVTESVANYITVSGLYLHLAV
ncbi:Nucleotidylyl transferase [Cristinia sonorae]|uniref:Nucleotidylyl transferase n=1 Tax=Cristinia sonorae TaxID=1940300 RepID=A0A8K0UQ58_9AGAR|nr:Nucleotidylyl transferase [Cristinia sonorae]